MAAGSTRARHRAGRGGWRRGLPVALAALLVTTAAPARAAAASSVTDVTLLGLTLTGPTDVVLGASRGFSGQLAAASTAGVPLEEIRLLVDGAVAATDTTALDGSYSALLTFSAYGTHTVQAVAHAGTATETRSAVLTVEARPGLDEAAPTDVYDATQFIHTGEDAVQTGVAPGAIEPSRASVLRGSVRTAIGAALDGVTMTVQGHAELGTTTSQDGVVDMVVNGGEPLTVRYAKPGYLPVEREVPVDWRSYEVLPDVVLTPVDAAVSVVESGAPEVTVARANAVTDGDGTRRATLLFPEGTRASMTLPDGSTQPLDTMHVRATEYTVGDAGLAAMPGVLPPASGYTYAVDYTVDEAVAAGATEVTFDRPVATYTENFLGFPVGSPVPAGYYDYDTHAWTAAPNGRVVEVVAVAGGVADLDGDGDGAADSGATLAALGVTDAEREKLGGLYAAGQELWRVPVTHFTPWDYNWPYGLPPGAVGPDGKPIPPVPGQCDKSGSIIGCENQTLGEAVPVVGAPFTLHYDTSRMPGYQWANSLRIPLTGATLPDRLNRVHLEVTVAGRRFAQEFAPAPNLQHTFVWDGKDAYGRQLQGQQEATVRVGYAYQAVYYSPAEFSSSFGRIGTSALSANRARQEITLYQQWQSRIGRLSEAGRQAVGGWTLSVHHAYDPDARVLHLGDGTTRPATALLPGFNRYAGTGAAGTGDGTFSGDGGPATKAGLSDVHGVATGPDGTLYVADSGNARVRRVAPDGTITTFAGGGVPLSGNGDGGPATAAELVTPTDVAVGTDGSVYVLDTGAAVVRRVAPDGVISTFAGGGWPADGLGDDGPATAAAFASPRGIATGPGGVVYVADTGHQRVRQIASDGVITTLAGGGAPADGLGDGGPAPQAALDHPLDVATGIDGDVYIADADHNRVRAVRRDGQIATVAGTGAPGASGDGGAAASAAVGYPTSLAVDPSNGALYVAQRLQHRVRMVDASGVVTTAAGVGTAGSSGDRGVPVRAQLRDPHAVAVGSDGRVYVGDTGNFQVRRILPPLPGFSTNDLVVPSSDGTELYQFDPTGRHLRTLDALTGLVRLRFEYDGAGRVTAVEDRFLNRTLVEWSGAAPAAIVSPYGARTTLQVDADGWLSRITNPADESVAMVYRAGGLLETFTNPRQQTSTFTYDALGRLTKDVGPDGSSTTLARTETATGHRVTATSAAGRVTTYEVVVEAGRVKRVAIEPSGVRSESSTLSDGTIRATDADGTVSTRRLGPDPRWGMQVPLPEQVTVVTPAGRSTTSGATRTVVLADPANPLAVASQTDTLTFNGRSAKTVYDAAAKTLTTTTATGRTKVTTLDANGLVASVKEGTLAATTYAYDSRGRVTTVTTGTGADARTTTYTYDAAGYVANVANGVQEVGHTYDAIGRVRSDVLPGGAAIGYGYDPNGNLTSVTPPGRGAHTFAYTAGDVLERYTAPEAGTVARDTTYAYDIDRLPTTLTRPGGKTVTYSHGASSGRLDGLTLARGTTGYTYDAASRPQRVEAPGGDRVSFAYDGDLLTGITSTGTGAGSVTYGYDSNLRVSSRAVNGAAAVAYGYNNDGALTSAGGLALGWDAANGLLTSAAIGSVSTSLGYNTFGEPVSTTTTATTAAGTATPYSASYVRDTLGRITSRTETVDGVTTTDAFTYDARGRLTDVVRDGVLTEHYEHDANGNRTAATTRTGSVTATYDAQDRLTTYGDAAFTYTPSGELRTRTVGSAVTTYDYDEVGALTKVALPDGRTVDYVVDGEGRRVGKKVGGAFVQRFSYGQGSLPAAELDAAGATVARFVYASRGHVPDYLTKGGATYRLVTDHVGSVRLVVDTATGAVAQRIDYDASGVVVADSNPGFQPFGFAGGLYDRDTGLVRFGVRDYDPAVGRFTAKDPAGFSGGDTNLYAYAAGDPVNLIDPNGLDWLQSTSDFFAGFGDAVTFGGTRAIRQLIGVDDVVNYCSGWYTGGGITGTVAFTVATWGAGGAAKGATLADDAARALPQALRGGPSNVHVYYGVRNGKPVYTGITNNVNARAAQHGTRFSKLEPLTTSGLTRGEARAIEEALMRRNPGFENIRHSISPRHKYYDDAVEWGEQWLRAHGL